MALPTVTVTAITIAVTFRNIKKFISVEILD
jgi:hypothetical protein